MADASPTRSTLRIDGANLRLVRLPLVTPFTIATGTTKTEKVFQLLTLRLGALEGYADGVMARLHYPLEETVAGAMDFLANVLLLQVLDRGFAQPEEMARLFAP